MLSAAERFSDSRCYIFVHVEKYLSWVTANLACVSHGGYLASLTSAQEWTEVIQVLEARPLFKDIYIGLRAADSSLPWMYVDENRFSDFLF